MAPKLPRNATVYIVAPHELFVTDLIPMTFFLLLLAFTDGTARTAEVLPRRALAQLAVAGDVLALDNNGVESYVYNSSLPAFQRCGTVRCAAMRCDAVPCGAMRYDVAQKYRAHQQGSWPLGAQGESVETGACCVRVLWRWRSA